VQWNAVQYNTVQSSDGLQEDGGLVAPQKRPASCILHPGEGE
jgi:hypothetical protein